jgi:hypothetical protein
MTYGVAARLRSRDALAGDVIRLSAAPMSARPGAPDLRGNPRFRHLSKRVHALGPRPCAEAMLAVAQGRDPLEVLEEYARLEPLVRAIPEARTWPPAPISRVA